MQFLTQKKGGKQNKINIYQPKSSALRTCCCCCCCRSFLALLMLVCRPVVSPFLICISIRFVCTDAVDYVWFSSEPRQRQLISPATSNQSYDLFLGAQHHMLCNRFFGVRAVLTSSSFYCHIALVNFSKANLSLFSLLLLLLLLVPPSTIRWCYHNMGCCYAMIADPFKAR